MFSAGRVLDRAVGYFKIFGRAGAVAISLGLLQHPRTALQNQPTHGTAPSATIDSLVDSESGPAADQLSCSPGVWTLAAAAASGLLQGAMPGAGHACLSSSEALTLTLTVLLSLLRTPM